MPPPVDATGFIIRRRRLDSGPDAVTELADEHLGCMIGHKQPAIRFALARNSFALEQLDEAAAFPRNGEAPSASARFTTRSQACRCTARLPSTRTRTYTYKHMHNQ